MRLFTYMTYMHKAKRSGQPGAILATLLIVSSAAAMILGAIIVWAGANVKLVRQQRERELALHVAEAGVNYYRWHLAHAPTDYKNGTNQNGPYVIPYYDKDGVKVGTYTLTITPPVTGSTVVTVESVGSLVTSSSSRAVRVKLAIPSIAKYAIVADANMRFGEGTVVNGLLHSNGGIRFDGTAYNLVTSARSTYTDTDSDACTSNSWAVHTCLGTNDPAPNTALPIRSDVFTAGRQFPIPEVDFVGLTSDLAQMKTLAQSNGRYLASSGSQGYRIVFRTDDKFDLYRVTSVTSASASCRNNSNSGAVGWGTWTISNGGGNGTFMATYNLPANGIIFVEDNVWVDGTINTARVTLVAARFPLSSNPPAITLNKDLRYTNLNGQDVIGLIAQGNINAGLSSASVMRIDAALISQNGRIGRYHYASQCGAGYVRNDLVLYGMLATNERYGFAYTDNTGYTNRIINYDPHLLYAPPPSFPLTSDHYELISWEEL